MLLLSNICSAIVVLATLTAVVFPSLGIGRQLSLYTVQLMFALLALGLVSLWLDSKRLLATSFVCCAVLCLHLKHASNDILVFPTDRDVADIEVSQINLSTVNDRYDEMLAVLRQSKPDIISFQEVNPAWQKQLSQDLKNLYPHQSAIVRIDPYGVALYSKYPLQQVDTFHTGRIPHITARVEVNDQSWRVISSYITPSLEPQSSQLAQAQLRDIADWVNLLDTPTIALGDYNMVYWSPELRAFRSDALLTHSRRESSVLPSDLPYEHIFFSQQIECTSFGSIWSANNNYVGVSGNYQCIAVDPAETTMVMPQTDRW